MSNRPRRRLLRQWQLLAIVMHGDASPDITDSIQSMDEWNGWRRGAFRDLWREPLRFPHNIRPDAGLINMQARNRPEAFNPLSGDPTPERPERQREHGRLNDLWDATEEAINSALDYLEPARRITRPRFAPWFCEVETIEDYPARFYRGFRKLRTGMTAVHQYGSNRSPWFPDHGCAARNVLCVDERMTRRTYGLPPPTPLTETELYALLSLAACWWALDDLLRLPESWSRDDLDFIAGNVQDAERWLAEAYRLKQADAREATVRAEEDTEKAAIRDAWAADSHREKSAKGGKAPKGSEGVRLLALALREEKTSASATALFLAALSRCGSKDNAVLSDLRRLAGGHTITANTEAQLVSIAPDGEPDGLPVGLAGWRKILRRKR